MRYRAIAIAAVLGAACWAPGCGPSPSSSRATKQSATAVRIGLLMDTLTHERWQRDRDLFVARAKELRANVLVEAAEGDAARQLQQAEKVLSEGVNVLVVVPHHDEQAAAIVEAARKRNVPVISYDRLIRNADVDLYVSFDNVKVGEMQASYLLSRARRGNYVLIGGAPTDHNAHLLREGQMNALKPAIDRGDVKIVADAWTPNWQASEAFAETEKALTKARNNVAAVVVSNDVTAGGVVQALEARKLAGRVLVSGQDAELEAARRIVAGSQAMTVYKPLRALVRLAVGAAITLAKGEKVDTIATINNGKKDVPAMLASPILVDKDSIDATLIADGYHKREAIYQAAHK